MIALARQVLSLYILGISLQNRRMEFAKRFTAPVVVQRLYERLRLGEFEAVSKTFCHVIFEEWKCRIVRGGNDSKGCCCSFECSWNHDLCRSFVLPPRALVFGLFLVLGYAGP